LFCPKIIKVKVKIRGQVDGKNGQQRCLRKRREVRITKKIVQRIRDKHSGQIFLNRNLKDQITEKKYWEERYGKT
jgi:hypothetical protein